MSFSADAAIVGKRHSPPPKKQGEEIAGENNSRPLLIAFFLLKIVSDGFSARCFTPLKTVEDAGLL